MPSLPRNTARYRMPKLRLLVTFVMLLFIGMGFASEVGAQPSTTLGLIDQVSEFGGGTVSGTNPESDTLSSGAQVAVLSRTADRAYALANLNKGHSDLRQKIRGGSAKVFRLAEDGRTPQAFEQTQASNKAYYVLALTGQGELLESYVLDENRGGYYPGFAQVVSGDMVMGPVPAEHREPLRAALKLAMSPVVAGTADGSQAGEDTARTSSAEEEQKRSESGGGTSGGDSRDGGGYLQVFVGAIYSPVGILLLGLLLGGLIAWGATYFKYKRELSTGRKRIESLLDKNHKLRKSKKNESKSISFKREKTNKDENKRIKSLKEEIKKKNEELKQKKKKIRRIRKEEGGFGSEKRSRGKTTQPNRTGNAPGCGQHLHEGASANRSSGPESIDRTIDLIGQAFVNWCNDAGAAMVDRHSMFAKRLEDGLPEAELQRIFREKNAAGIVFANDVQDAVEYWLVRADGKDFLLPQPQRSGFREVEKCFKASCTSPNQLSEFEPAELQSSSDKYELKSEGRLV